MEVALLLFQLASLVTASKCVWGSLFPWCFVVQVGASKQEHGQLWLILLSAVRLSFLHGFVT